MQNVANNEISALSGGLASISEEPIVFKDDFNNHGVRAEA